MKKIITALALIFTILLPSTSTAFEESPGYTYVVFTGKYTYYDRDSNGRSFPVTTTYVNRPLKVDLSKYTIKHASEAFKYKTKSDPSLLINTEDRRSIEKTLKETHPTLMKRGGHKRITINTIDLRKAKEGKLTYGR